MTDPTAAERARAFVCDVLRDEIPALQGDAVDEVAVEIIAELTGRPSLLAALAVEAGGMEQDGWRFEAPQVFGSEWSPGVTPPPFPNRWPVYRRVEGERE